MDDGGSCVTVRERQEGVESYTLMIEFNLQFFMGSCVFS